MNTNFSVDLMGKRRLLKINDEDSLKRRRRVWVKNYQS